MKEQIKNEAANVTLSACNRSHHLFSLPLATNCNAQMPIFISKFEEKFSTTISVRVVTQGDTMTATYSWSYAGRPQELGMLFPLPKGTTILRIRSIRRHARLVALNVAPAPEPQPTVLPTPHAVAHYKAAFRFPADVKSTLIKKGWVLKTKLTHQHDNPHTR